MNTLDARMLSAVDPTLARTVSRLYLARAALPFSVGDTPYEARCEAHAVQAAAQAYRFTLGDAPGWLLLDAAAERAWLADAADAHVPQALRCAVLADALAPLTRAIEHRSGRALTWLPEAASPDVRLDRPDVLHMIISRRDGEPAEDRAASWQARAGLLFDAPQALAELCPAELAADPIPLAAFMGTQVPLRFELGATFLSRRDFAGIALGDIVRIEKWLPAGDALRCVARVRGRLHLRVFGQVQGNRIVVENVEEKPMTTDSPATTAVSAPEPAARPLPTDSLDDIELVTTFELEERRLSLAELRALRPGTVMELAQPLNQAVIRILANGMPVGEGHLIAVGNRLGVRVSRFIGQPAPGQA
ncbi:YscQ/HrcQ family type III secretion apparatus protein [Ralstonia pickettii]|uniref:YscQ/HrcQ family type III secretion apparatus protein n=1 Tax=Ralstonia pickettii TaxID=329 RepID=A0A2N4TQ98_RALPI|nr:type III secretion system cytoplasmic ring protein SctQ [Ralstonia pickettii]PLC41878.1 YscQ/HrcQ family type III secretion apparatus protein [Ralstonia pickettii]